MAFLCVFFSMIPMLLLVGSSPKFLAEARQFDVGGRDGWVVKPSEDYNHWAQRNRFQVNDTLHFKYNKGIDSVVVVKKEDFDSCNINTPIQKMDDGDSIFPLSHSGLFYFVSGNPDNCKTGQKLIVLVMAVRQPLPKAVPPAASTLPPQTNTPPPQTNTLPPQTVPATGLTSPAPPPLNKSGSGRVGVSVSVSVGLGVLLGFVLGGFVGLD